jgi:hypothetical protein
MPLELTRAEEVEILARRERERLGLFGQRAVNQAGSYGVPQKPDVQRQSLLSSLDALNDL